MCESFLPSLSFLVQKKEKQKPFWVNSIPDLIEKVGNDKWKSIVEQYYDGTEDQVSLEQYDTYCDNIEYCINCKERYPKFQSKCCKYNFCQSCKNDSVQSHFCAHCNKSVGGRDFKQIVYDTEPNLDPVE